MGNMKGLFKRLSVTIMCAVLVSSVLLFINAPRASAAPDTWTETTDTDFQDSFDAGFYNDVVLRDSGANAYIELNMTWGWHNMTTDTNPDQRDNFCFAYDTKNDVAILFGGRVSGEGKKNDTWKYDLATNTWSQIIADGAPGNPERRDRCHCDYDSVNEKVVLWGGVNASSIQLSDTWEFDVDTYTWVDTRPSPAPPSMPGYSLAYDSLNSVTLMVGTNDDPAGAGNLYVWAYDAATDSWFEGSPTPFPRFGHSMAFNGDVMIIQGGGWGVMTPIEYDDTLKYDWGSDTWERRDYETEDPPTRPRPGFRTGNAMARFFGGVYDVGGHNGFIYLDDNWNFTGTGDGWDWFDQTPIGGDPKPDARSMHGMVWDSTDKCLILYGGYGWYGRYNTTWAYCPGYASEGWYVSKVGSEFYFDPNGYPDWLNIWWNQTAPPMGTKIKFQLQGDNDSIPGNGSPGETAFLGPAGTISDYYETPGEKIYDGLDGLGYIRYKAFLEGTTTASPKLEDVTISYDLAGPPFIKETDPADGDDDVLVDDDVIVVFSKTMNTGVLNWSIVPDPGSWSVVWSSTYKPDDTVTFSHGVSFIEGQTYLFSIHNAEDTDGNPLTSGPVPNPWSFKTVTGEPWIESTIPANNATDVPVNQDIVITFSEQINTSTFTFSLLPNPGGWSWGWTGGDTVATGSHAGLTPCQTYVAEVTAAEDPSGNPLTDGPVPNPWTFEAICEPYIVYTIPANAEQSVALTQDVVIKFSESINTGTFSFTITPDPGGWSWVWSDSDTLATGSHIDFNASTNYTAEVLAAEDLAGNPLGPGIVPNPWWFETGGGGGPQITDTDPEDGEMGVPVDYPVTITFSEQINTVTFAYTIDPDPGGWNWVWTMSDTVATGTHNSFDPCTEHLFTVTAADNMMGGSLQPGSVPNPWTFTTECNAPGNLKVERSDLNVIIRWDPVPGATEYRVYESQDRFALWSLWNMNPVMAPTTTYTHIGAGADGLTHYYIVRAYTGAESDNSTMGVKTELSFTTPPVATQTDIHWFSLPYVSMYKKASDIASELGSGNITMIGKWDPAKQRAITYSYIRGRWRGTDFDINPGDGLFLAGIVTDFDWVINGTDIETTLMFSHDPPYQKNVNWVGIPYTGIYDSASSIVLDLEVDLFTTPMNIVEIGKWDPLTQTSTLFYWDSGSGTWIGTDFSIDPGDGIYFRIIADFNWDPALLTPTVP